MSKERLEELKGVLKSWEAWNDWNESQRIVLKDLTYYLERVQDLEGDAENIYRANHDYSRRNDILTQQNKRYREAMKKIRKLTETDAGTEEQVFIIADDILLEND